MALDSAVRADDDPDPAPATTTAHDQRSRPQTGLVRWGASRWSWYDDTAAARLTGAPRQRGPARPQPVGSSSV